MSVFERLGKSAQNHHGMTLTPDQVREVVFTVQAMQVQIGEQALRADGVTRIAACALSELGGELNIVPDMYAEAEGLLRCSAVV